MDGDPFIARFFINISLQKRGFLQGDTMPKFTLSTSSFQRNDKLLQKLIHALYLMLIYDQN